MEARLLPDSAPTPGCLGNMSMILSLLLWWISSEIFSRFRRALEYLAFVSFMADCKSVTFCFWCCSFMSSCCFTSKYGLEVRVIFEWVKIIQLEISGILFTSNELFANYYKPLANCTWNFDRLVVAFSYPAFWMDLLNFFSSCFNFFSQFAHLVVASWCRSSLSRFSFSASITWRHKHWLKWFYRNIGRPFPSSRELFSIR